MKQSQSGVQKTYVDVSIIICTFQRATGLERLLHSIDHQITDLKYETVVVDNHPSSHSCDQLKRQFPSVRWINEVRQGLSFARNAGIRAARAQVVAFADDDMEVDPDWLQALATPVLVQGFDVACGPVIPIKLDTESERLFDAYGSHGHNLDLRIFNGVWLQSQRFALPLWQVGGMGNSAVRRSAFLSDRGGNFEEALGAGTPAGSWEDLYFIYRLLRANGSVIRHPAATVRHAHRETLPELSKQLCDYRRGEVACCLLVLLRHGDLRGLSHLCAWIPIWRIQLFFGEIARRVRGKSRFRFHLMMRETLAYFSGPLVLIASMRRAKRLRRAFKITSVG